MKKVLIISSVASMIDQFNKNNIGILQELGYEVHVATNFENPGTITKSRASKLQIYLEEQCVKYYQIDFNRNPLNIKRTCEAYSQIKEISLNENYELVHMHSPIGGIIGRIVFRKKQSLLIYTAHGFHFFKGSPIKNWLLYYPIEKYFSKYTNTLITINKEDFKISKRKFYADKNEYIPGVGVDVNLINNCVKQDNIMDYYLNFFKLICVGELNNNKNQSFLVDVVAELKKILPNVVLFLVGTGPFEEKLRKKCKNLNIENNVIFLGYREDVPYLIKNSDVLLSVSKREGLPINVIEGMACGKPLIVSNCRGNRDLVKNDINGFVIKKYDVSIYADKIYYLYKNPNIRLSMQDYNLKEVLKYSSIEINKRMLNIYENI